MCTTSVIYARKISRAAFGLTGYLLLFLLSASLYAQKCKFCSRPLWGEMCEDYSCEYYDHELVLEKEYIELPEAEAKPVRIFNDKTSKVLMGEVPGMGDCPVTSTYLDKARVLVPILPVSKYSGPEDRTPWLNYIYRYAIQINGHPLDLCNYGGAVTRTARLKNTANYSKDEFLELSDETFTSMLQPLHGIVIKLTSKKWNEEEKVWDEIHFHYIFEVNPYSHVFYLTDDEEVFHQKSRRPRFTDNIILQINKIKDKLIEDDTISVMTYTQRKRIT